MYSITLNEYLKPRRPVKKVGNVSIHSSFLTSLREIRILTGRSKISGKILKGKSIGYPGHMYGAAGYLMILDQIGACFRPTGKSKVGGNEIVKALTYFTRLTEPQIYALFALRCSLAHNFSLINLVARHPKKELLEHKFSLNMDPFCDLIKLPSTKWNAEIDSSDNNKITIINVVKLGDMVEDIVKQIRALAEENELEVELDGGLNELIKRYTIHVAD
jgi:hypothetical protein